jgi:peroxiredoxin
VDDAADARGIVDAHGLELHVLYDTDFTVTRSWGIFNLLDDGVAAPATYIFNRDGDLVAYHIGETVSDRPAAREVVDALAEAG